MNVSALSAPARGTSPRPPQDPDTPLGRSALSSSVQAACTAALSGPHSCTRCLQNVGRALSRHPVSARSPVLRRQPEEDQRPVHGEHSGAACPAPYHTPRLTEGLSPGSAVPLLWPHRLSCVCQTGRRNRRPRPHAPGTPDTGPPALLLPPPGTHVTLAPMAHRRPSGPCPTSSHHGGLAQH